MMTERRECLQNHRTPVGIWGWEPVRAFGLVTARPGNGSKGGRWDEQGLVDTESMRLGSGPQRVRLVGNGAGATGLVNITNPALRRED